MKKLLALIISSAVVAVLAVCAFFGLKNYRDNKSYVLNISAGNGGAVSVTIDKSYYSVKSGTSDVCSAKRKSKVSLLAKPNDNYVFTGWKINGKDYSTEPTINISVKQKTSVQAFFEMKTISVTVKDDTLNETFDLNLANNLLQTLNTRYSSSLQAGYSYVYKINDEQITTNTFIAENAEITREKVLNQYFVYFKHNGVQQGDAQVYTVEDKTGIVPPTITPEVGYTITWEDYNLDTLRDIVVNSITTPIDYTVKFILADATFADNSASKEVVYHITDTVDSVKANFSPMLADIMLPEHYEMAYPEFTLTYDENTTLEVTLSKQPIVYTIKFVDGDQTYGEATYTILNKVFTAPEVPSVEFYKDCAWPAFEIPETLGNHTLELIKTPIEYSISYVLPTGYTFDGTNSTITKTYTIENFGEELANRPALPEAHAGYTIAWEDVTLTQDNLKTLTTINAVESLIKYTATFHHNGTDVGTVEFDKTTIANITANAPDAPTDESGYEYRWENYTVDPANIGNITIYSVKLVKVQLNFVIEDEANYELNDIASFYFIAVAVDKDSNVITNESKPVIYNHNDNGKFLVEDTTDYISLINNAVIKVNPEDSNVGNPAVKSLQLNNETAVEVDDLATEFFAMLNNCKENHTEITITYVDFMNL